MNRLSFVRGTLIALVIGAAVVVWAIALVLSVWSLPPSPPSGGARVAASVGASGTTPDALTPVALTSVFVINAESAPDPVLWSKPTNPCWYGPAGSVVTALYDPVAHTLTVPCSPTINQPVTKP